MRRVGWRLLRAAVIPLLAFYVYAPTTYASAPPLTLVSFRFYDLNTGVDLGGLQAFHELGLVYIIFSGNAPSQWFIQPSPGGTREWISCWDGCHIRIFSNPPPINGGFSGDFQLHFSLDHLRVSGDASVSFLTQYSPSSQIDMQGIIVALGGVAYVDIYYRVYDQITIGTAPTTRNVNSVNADSGVHAPPTVFYWEWGTTHTFSTAKQISYNGRAWTFLYWTNNYLPISYNATQTFTTPPLLWQTFVAQYQGL